MPDAADLIRFEIRGGIIVASILSPSIDSANADRLVGLVSERIAAEGRRLRGVVLDFAAVTFINSRGLAACIDVARTAERAGARTAAAALGPDLVRVFEVMRVDRLLPLVPDVATGRTRVRTPDEPAG